MIIFELKTYSSKDKASLERSLRQRILSPNEYPFYIFPLCLFSNQFYRDLKRSGKGLFSGEISNGKFELARTSIVFSTRTWLPVAVKGSIKDNEIAIKYLIPNYIVIATIALIIADLFTLIGRKMVDGKFVFVAGIIALSYFIKLYKTTQTFKTICN